jgi:hypothetical protein
MVNSLLAASEIGFCAGRLLFSASELKLILTVFTSTNGLLKNKSSQASYNWGS